MEAVIRSRAFVQSHRIRRFLQFIVEESLTGQQHRLKEYLIGLEVFDRREAFDPRVDSIVRVEARRLRHKLEEYYRTEGHGDSVHIVLRKGSYVPTFEYRVPLAGPPSLLQRRAVEIAPFSLVRVTEEKRLIADEVQRRVAHVLIKEGCFQVVPQPPAPVDGETIKPTHARPDCAVEGSIEFGENQFHLILQLQQCPDRSYIWSESLDCQVDDLNPVNQLAQALVRDLTAPTLEGAASRRQAKRAESSDSYLQGRYHWKLGTPSSIRSSANYFAKAVETDENYAAAWAALAESLVVSSMFGLQTPEDNGARMGDAARRATTLNPMLPEAHLALGAVLSLLDWDWTAGEAELEKSIQLDNHDPVGHIAYGIHLACRGKFADAQARVECALNNDPASLFANFVLGWLYGVSERLDEAVAQHLLVSRLAPDYTLPHLGLGMAYAGKGMFADALACLTNAMQMKCGSLIHGLMGYCYARAGRKEEALGEIGNLMQQSGSSGVSPVNFAAIYAGLNDTEKAFSYLEQAVQSHDTSLPVQLLSPEFDGLRSQPRFQAIRERIGVTA